MRDEVIRLWKAGHTYHEIAMTLRISRSSVAGHVYRHRAGASTEQNVSHLSKPGFKERAEQVLRETGGNRRQAAKILEVRRGTVLQIARQIDAPAPRVNGAKRGKNLASDPATREMIDRVTNSGLTDKHIADVAGVSHHTISGWRRGKRGKPFLLQCVNEALERLTHDKRCATRSHQQGELAICL